MENEASKLSPEELEEIKKYLLDSIYKDIGKSVVKKFLWVVGSIIGLIFLAIPYKEKVIDLFLK